MARPLTIYDATLGRQLPGLPLMHVVYPWRRDDVDLYPGNTDRRTVPTPERMAAALAPAIKEAAAVLIDLEATAPWSATWSVASELEREWARDHWCDVLDVARRVAPGLILTGWQLAWCAEHCDGAAVWHYDQSNPRDLPAGYRAAVEESAR